MSDNQRNEYRIEYPIADRPRLVVDDREYDVLDLSEGGLRVLGVNLGSNDSGVIDALVRFVDGEEIEVQGRVLRQVRKQCAIQLDRKKLPYRKIVREQRRLLSKYRMRIMGRSRRGESWPR